MQYMFRLDRITKTFQKSIIILPECLKSKSWMQGKADLVFHDSIGKILETVR